MRRSWGYQKRTHLVSEGMTTNDDGLDPTWDGLWDLREDDGLTEDCAAENISDLLLSRSVRRLGNGVYRC